MGKYIYMHFHSLSRSDGHASSNRRQIKVTRKIDGCMLYVICLRLCMEMLFMLLCMFGMLHPMSDEVTYICCLEYKVTCEKV